MNGIPQKATTLREIRLVCTPKPLVGEELETFFVETDSSRDPHQDTRRKLRETFEENNSAHVLFVGHRGCGKSTELNKFLREEGDRFFPVTFSVMDEMSMVAVRAEDLILVITQRILQKAKEEKIRVSDSILQGVEDFFAAVTKKTSQFTDANLTCGAGVSTQGTLLDKVLGLFAKLTAEIKLDVHSEETAVFVLRKRPEDLLAQANCVIEAVRNALPENKKLLIIVEDLDKLDGSRAREIFVENTNLLIGLRATIVYTIPIFVLYSPEASAFKHKFEDIIRLPMIKVFEPGTPPTKSSGFDVIRKIILERVEDNLITDDAINLLIEKTGGVLRQAFQVLQTASRMSTVSVPLGVEHIQYGLNQLRKEYWQEIALPYSPIDNGPKSVDELYDRLAEYAQMQLGGKKISPTTNPINQILLQSAAIVEYNGEGWFGVHPLVIENLRELGRI